MHVANLANGINYTDLILTFFSRGQIIIFVAIWLSGFSTSEKGDLYYTRTAEPVLVEARSALQSLVTNHAGAKQQQDWLLTPDHTF